MADDDALEVGMVIPAGGPVIGQDVTLEDPAFIHPSAQIYGGVILREKSSVWANVVMRCESGSIVIGERSNIQDFVMIHGGGPGPVTVGKDCSITHRVTLHGASVGDNCLIGIGAILMDGVVIGDNSIVAGGSFLKEGTIIPENSIVMGTPGQVTRTRNNYAANKMNALIYYRNALAYATGYHREWGDPRFDAEVADEVAEIREEMAALRKAAETQSA